MILVDTNVWSEASRRSGNATVLAWMAAHAARLWLSTIVIAEIRFGIENPAATAKRSDLERWLADIEVAHADRIADFDTVSAHVFGRLLAQRKNADEETKLLDIQIAAQAIARDCPVATRNVRDFAWTGVRLIDPWTA